MTDQMVRRLGDNTGRRDCVPPPPTIAFCPRRQVPKFVTDVMWTVYELAGPVLPDGATLRRHLLRAVAAAVFLVLVAAATSASAAQASRTSLFQLRRHVSRPVGRCVSLSLKDVAVSQNVCSCGEEHVLHPFSAHTWRIFSVSSVWSLQRSRRSTLLGELARGKDDSWESSLVEELDGV